MGKKEGCNGTVTIVILVELCEHNWEIYVEIYIIRLSLVGNRWKSTRIEKPSRKACVPSWTAADL